MEFANFTIAQLVRQMADKKLTATQLVKEAIAQVERVNPVINAVVQLRKEQALKEAYALDEEFNSSGLKGPLHGIPFTIKDVHNTKGDITTCGTLGLKHHRATEDAVIVKRLKDAGAILVGKTNTPEFAASAETDNLVYGRTTNPYRAGCSAGGSSGGGAAIVAAGGVVFDIGGDYGGSLRIPAHYCGISTIRPTVGRIPGTGLTLGQRTGFAGLLATDGPLARFPEDLELLLKIISGPDGIDPKVISMPLLNSDNVDISQLHIAYFIENGVANTTADTAETIDKVAKYLVSERVNIKADRPDVISEAYDILFDLASAPGDRGYRALLEKYGTKEASPLLENAMKLFRDNACDSMVLMKRWSRWENYRCQMQQFFQKYDVIICPVLAAPASEKPEHLSNKSISYCWMTSLANCTVAVVRAGTSEDGLPIGVQIIAKPWREDIAIAVAKKIAHGLGGWQAPRF